MKIIPKNLLKKQISSRKKYSSLYRRMGIALLLLTNPVMADQEAGSKQEEGKKGSIYQKVWKLGEVPGAEWTTKGTVMSSPSKTKEFLGKIRDEAVTSLSLKKLPEHQVLTIEVELFVVGTWDGSNHKWGQDKLNISLGDKRVLMDTTFSNCMANNWSGTQHYPEDLTGRGVYKCFTGISSIGELGYRQVWARYKPVQNVPIDSTYKLKFSVPHRGDAVTLNFKSEANDQEGGSDDQEEQWYGIGKVTVSVHEEQEVSEGEWLKLRNQLLNSFIPISNRAFWEMMRYPKRFSSDLQLMQQVSSKKRWWYKRAERLLNEKPNPVKKVTQ